jgi:CRISPR system Cascade subunit CasC
MFIELHIIQNFAPSNLNRDDTNNPKDCVFGGTRRARISSQCLKRAIRLAPVFEQTVGQKGIRTRLIAREFQRRLEDAGVHPGQAAKVAMALAKAYTVKAKKDKGKQGNEAAESEQTNVLIYLSPQEIDDLTRKVLDDWSTVTADFARLQKIVEEFVKETKGRTTAPDIALFGRMLADRPETNVDAACQVAHAISTHRVSMDIDFFTAVDDLQTREETGAGMMGIMGFNSATFYRYARLDWEQLVTNLYGQTDAARRAVEGFLRAAVEAVPTGKQNTFAAHNPPSFILAVVREGGMGWSLANAFERPVVGGEGGLVKPSVEALDAYWGKLVNTYGFNGIAAAVVLDDGVSLNNLAWFQKSSLEECLQQIMAALPQE